MRYRLGRRRGERNRLPARDPRAFRKLSVPAHRWDLRRRGCRSCNGRGRTWAARRRSLRASIDLAKVPDWLADKTEGHTRLRWLFEPERAMRPAYELFMALFPLSARSVWRLVGKAARHFPVSFFGGAALGVTVGALGTLRCNSGRRHRCDGCSDSRLSGAEFSRPSCSRCCCCSQALPSTSYASCRGYHFGVTRGYSQTPETRSIAAGDELDVRTDPTPRRQAARRAADVR